jgi:hypothetical protein
MSNIAQKPKDLGRALYSSMPPVIQAVLGGAGAIGSDIMGAFRGSPDSGAEKENKTQEKTNDQLKEVAENTSETNDSIKNLIGFMKGNQLEEYEREREEQIKHEQLVNAIEDIGAGESIEEESGGFFAPIIKGFKAIIATITKVALAIGAALAGIIKAVAAIGLIFGIVKLLGSDNIEKIFTEIKKTWNEDILPAIMNIRDAIVEFWEGGFGDFVLGAWEKIKAGFVKIGEFFSNFGEGIANFLIDSVGILGDTLSGVFDGIASIFRGDFKEGIITIFKSLGSGIINLFDSLWTNVLSVFGIDFGEDGSVLGFMKRKFTEFGDFVKEGIDNITGFFRSIPERIRETVSGKISQIVDFFSESVETITGFFSRIRERLTGLLPNWARRLIGVDEGSDQNGTSVTDETRPASSGDMSPAMKLRNIQAGVLDPKSLTTPILNELLNTVFPSSAENRRHEDAKRLIMMELQNRRSTGPALSAGELAAFGLEGGSGIEPIQNQSALISETANALTLQDIESMMGERREPAPSMSQINVNSDSSSNIVMPQYSPNARPETAQDVFGQPAY